MRHKIVHLKSPIQQNYEIQILHTKILTTITI